MTAPTSDVGDAAARGRAAAGKLAWDEAYAAFSQADTDALSAEDVQAWATAAYLLGHVDTAVDALARAYRMHLDAGDPCAALRCGFWIIFIQIGRGDVAQASGWMSHCGHLLDRIPADGAEQSYLSVIHAFRLTAIEQRYAEGRQMADGVVEVARRTGDDDLLALGLNVAGRARIRAGQVEEGLARLDEAMVAVVSGTLSPPAAGSVYCSLIDACEEIAEYGRSLEWTDALTRWCDRQQGMITFTGQCLTHRATILRRQGDWMAAETQVTQARERFAGAADERATGKALYELGEVHRLAGDFTAAEDAYRGASDWGHNPQPGLALLRLAQGRVDAATTTMRRELTERTDAIERIRLLPAAVQILLANGDVAAASHVAGELREIAAAYGTSALHAEADLAQGAVHLAADEPDQALIALRRASETWRSLKAPYETARARALVAQACRNIGDEDAAALELAAARRVFTELGAVPDLNRLSLAVDQSPFGLSGRELEVLRMVATGKTNSEIAAELHLAVKTVERHVANILTKLGVPSRTAATALAYEHGLI